MAIQIRTNQIASLQITTALIDNAAVSNDKLAGAIADSKLNTITSANKVSGSAIQLAASSGLQDSSGLKIAAGGVVNAMLQGGIAFDKLADSANICRLDQAENIGAVWAFGSNIPTANQPTTGTQVANKDYVDAVAAGLDPKDSVKAATTGNISLSGTQTIDGVSILASDRVLVKNQSNAVQNGIYVAAGGSWSRAIDFAAGEDEAGSYMFVEQGTVNADVAYVCTNNKGSGVVGTDALTFSIFGRAGEITAGDGLQKSGSVISADLAANKGLEIIAGELAAKVNAATGMQVDSNGIGLALATNPALQITSNALEVKLDGSTLTKGAGGMKIADDGVTKTQINSNVAGSGLGQAGDGALEVDLAANSGLTTGGGELAMQLDGSTLAKGGSGVKVADNGITSTQIANNAVGASQLANSSVDGAKIVSNAISLDKCSFRYFREKFTGNGSATTFDLGRALSANFTDAVQVFRNGVFMELAGSPSDVDMFSVSATGGAGGVGRITIGAAPANTDVLYVIYPA